MRTWFEISVIKKPGLDLPTLELERLAKNEPEPWGKAEVAAYPVNSKERLHELYGSLCEYLIAEEVGFKIPSKEEALKEMEEENFIELWKSESYFCFIADNFMVGCHIVESFLAEARVTA